jgi:hypothetical protein
VVRPRLPCDLPRREAACADLDEQPLGGVEQRLLGLVPSPCRNLSHLTYAFD